MQLGRKPTDKELCKYIGVGIKALQAIKKANYRDSIQSLDESLPGTEDVLLSESIPDRSVDIENSVIDSMMEQGLKAELWQIVQDNVTENENKAIVARFRGNMSLKAAGQMMGISLDRVRQLEANALRKLQRPRIIRHLEEKFEVNYARAYCGSVTNFRYTGTSIVEDIALKNIENELRIIRIILERKDGIEILSKREIELAHTYHLIDKKMEIVKEKLNLKNEHYKDNTVREAMQGSHYENPL